MSDSKKFARLVFAICLIVSLGFALYIYITNSRQARSDSKSDSLSVIFIDVGQADSILVTVGDDALLIDAGSKSSSKAVLEELQEQKVNDIDVLVATHPHEDHIGGMAEVIEEYDIGKVYMADTGSDSKTYSDLMDMIEAKSIPVIEAYAGLKFELAGALCTIVSPPREADYDANNESVVILLDYYDSEFLFTGDVEKKAENMLILSGYDFDADVLKVAHHGSSTGTLKSFLQEASPKYAVISCGENNSYGHPHEATLELLQEYEAEVYRTDVSGDITFISDGQSIDIVLERPE